jgi:hypothetical protein
VFLVLKACSDRLESIQEDHAVHGAIQVNGKGFAQVGSQIVQKLIPDLLIGLRAQLDSEPSSGICGKQSFDWRSFEA